jgi:N-acetylmuramoyl-L-alanine amidase
MVIFWLFSLAALASSLPPWQAVNGQAGLPLRDWARIAELSVIESPKSGRVVLEGKGMPPILMLPGTPFALRGGQFLRLSSSLARAKNGALLLSAAGANELFLPLWPKEPKGWPRPPGAPRGPAPCKMERPVRKVFLDPGHGGTDLGTSRGGIDEKAIVLRFADLAAQELRASGFEVSQSRTKDVFLPLDIRNRLAMEWQADIFVSLHVNHSPSATAQGTETYILSPDATDDEARRLALLENSAAERKAKSKASAIQDILWDMEQTAYLQDSAFLAAFVQESLVGTALRWMTERGLQGEWRNRGVRQAPFFVLSRAPMPAILVELGYLSHKRDREFLQKDIFLQSLAKALAQGIKKYRDICVP